MTDELECKVLHGGFAITGQVKLVINHKVYYLNEGDEVTLR